MRPLNKVEIAIRASSFELTLTLKIMVARLTTDEMIPAHNFYVWKVMYISVIFRITRIITESKPSDDSPSRDEITIMVARLTLKKAVSLFKFIHAVVCC
jgi:hypothetical protein